MKQFKLYLIRNLTKVFLSILFITYFFQLIIQLIRILPSLLNNNLDLLNIFYMFGILSIRYINTSMLIGIFIATVYCFNTLRKNRELIAMYNAKITKSILVKLLLGFTTVIFLLALVFEMYLIPLSNKAYRHNLNYFEISSLDKKLQARKFASIQDMTFYIGDNQQGKLQNIFIYDNRNKKNYNVIFALSGKILAKDNDISLVMKNGSQIIKQKPKISYIEFQSNSLNIKKISMNNPHSIVPNEITIFDLFKLNVYKHMNPNILSNLTFRICFLLFFFSFAIIAFLSTMNKIVDRRKSLRIMLFCSYAFISFIIVIVLHNLADKNYLFSPLMLIFSCLWLIFWLAILFKKQKRIL